LADATSFVAHAIGCVDEAKLFKKFAEGRAVLRRFFRKRCLRPTRDQLDGVKFQGKRLADPLLPL
jgi:hypothetical protein